MTSSLELLQPDEIDWERLDAFADRTLFQTRDWLRFVSETQSATPVVARVREGSEEAGFFSGLVSRRSGLRLLGSPLPGWTTPYMGFNLRPGASRGAALAALPAFAFGTLGCAHLEVMDRFVSPADVTGSGYRVRDFQTWEVDLEPSDAALFDAMSSACRRNVRKASREGLEVEEGPLAGFAETYYGQLQEVFAKQGLAPTYSEARVDRLLELFGGTDRLLLLRVVTRDGDPAATGIYVIFRDRAYLWGTASSGRHQLLRPNELLYWHAMQTLKSRGIRLFDLGGAGEYKRKYGGRSIVVPWLRRSRYPGLERLRQLAQRAVGVRQALRARRRGPG